MKRLISVLSIAILSCVLMACSAFSPEQPERVPEPEKSFGLLKPNEKQSLMNYSFIGSQILQRRCVVCHDSSKKVNFETYELVKANLQQIKDAVFVKETMPKLGTLTEEEKRLLWNWIFLEAPFQSEVNPPEIDSLTPSYESIQRHIFEPACITCHNETNTGKRVRLDRQSLLDSPLVLIDLENVDESGLLVALNRKDEKRMPPEKEGYAALKPEQIQIIRDWIKNGAN